MKLILLMIGFTLCAQAGVDPFVLIRGTVGGSFNDKEIKVKDSFGQVYTLPRSFFPKDFVPKTGKEFSVQVPSSMIKSLKIEKKNP